LQTNQYQDLTSFCDVGTVLPLSTNTKGHVILEVAPARITLPRPDHAGSQLDLQVALIRDLRRLVPAVPDEEEALLPSRWDADLPRHERAWWQEGWQATATPAKEMTAKLIPIVTTAPTIDAIELAQTYIHRWPAQENVIKDYLLPLGLDTNHGFAKGAVENSEVAKQRTLSCNDGAACSNGHRTQANERYKLANDGSDCAKSTKAAAMNCTES
jgi:hypothetical protein